MFIKLREKRLQIGFDRIFVKRKLCEFSCRTRNIDDVYNVQNDRIRAPSRIETHQNG